MKVRSGHLYAVFVAVLISGGILTALAFTGPSTSPGSGGGLIAVPPTGGLQVSTTTNFLSQVCLSGDCRSSWPSGGGSGAFWQLGTNGIYYVSSTRPKVSIGTSAPIQEWYFSINRTATDVYPTDNILTGSNYWIDSSIGNANSSTYKGLYGFVGGDTSNSINSFIGAHGFTRFSGTGTITSMIGSMGSARVDSGTVSTLSGLLGQVFVFSPGTVSTAAALRIQTPTVTGNLTNLHGIYIDNQNVGVATNKYALYYNGSSKVVVTANSNVGIGTSAPAYQLDINNSGTAQSRLLTSDSTSDSIYWLTSGSGSGGESKIHFGDSGDPDNGRIVWNNELNEMQFYTENTQRAVIKSNGYVGIGTTAPTQKLHVTASQSTSLLLEATTPDTDTGIYFYEGVGQLVGFKIRYRGDVDQLDFIDMESPGGGSRLVIERRQPGRVGIATTTPAYQLDVYGGDIRARGYLRGDTGVCVAGDCRTAWPSGGAGGGGGSSYWALGTGGIYYTSSTNPNVGIGVSAPTAALDVAGAGKFSGEVILSTPSGNLLSSSDTGTQAITLTNDNITGINTLMINDTGAGEGIDWGSGRGISVYDTTQGGYNAFVFDTSASYPFVFNTGNVGIGTTAPAYALDVSGDVRWSGTLQGGSVPWARLSSFPSGCPAGQAVQVIGTTPTCIAVGGGGISGGGTATQIAFFTGVSAIGSDSNLYWNNTSKRLGIGTSNPQASLEVNGGIRLNTGAGKPTCSLITRGLLWITQNAVSDDVLEVCIWNGLADIYQWKKVTFN